MEDIYMQVSPLVSIVIITYNQEKYIEQTINCALAQKTVFEFEIVIGEDCSNDTTREICLKYQEEYPNVVRIITSDKNVGMLDNWHRTVKAAKGKYIAGCGGDDYWHSPDKLQKQVQFLEENPEYGMVHSEVDFYFQETGRLVKSYYASGGYAIDDSAADILERLLGGSYLICASTVVHRKELFDKYFNLDEFKRRGFPMEDTPFWADIIENSRIKYLRESLVTYRVLGESMTQSKDELKKLKFWKSNADMCLYLCGKYTVSRHVSEGIEKYWCRVALRLAFLEMRFDLADEVIRKCPKQPFANWVWYLGCKYRYLRPLVHLLILIARRKRSNDSRPSTVS